MTTKRRREVKSEDIEHVLHLITGRWSFNKFIKSKRLTTSSGYSFAIRCLKVAIASGRIADPTK